MPQSDPGFWTEVAAGLAAVLSGISAWAWVHTHGIIGKKAEVRTVDELLVRFEAAIQNQCFDNQRIFDQIKDVVDTHSAFAQECVKELGKRPTRDECQVFWRSDRGR